eukprot:CAMPEP_0172548162 /NCGR_PEP_ID=MMETSP1067-20121228/17531_1 /TAXON_ID=265564 ORGANISM="Thalassiosira punctigera, Strain Tpunct2005C2" /NCGR_SAMPLE_ID=MMETSP1067 /ASSEMBLY_ACC=CAM_ASM_000444 /LENGTH=1499 /DNA_ID=CAMNT_0013335357 /DNA_START=220 /DNA_END=4719 /DNA_ORIENTATION=-
MNKLSSVLFFTALSLLCTVMWPISYAAASLLISDQGQELLSTSLASSFTLPSRSDIIISSVLNHRRNLQASEFSSLNQIFDQVSIKLPNAKVSHSGLDLTITNIECRNLNVQDIRLSHDVESRASQRLEVDIHGLKVNCSFRFEYKWRFFSGSGSGTGELDPSSSMSFDLQFASDNFDTRPPHDVSVQHCNPVIIIKDMHFDDDGTGVVSGMANLFEGALKDTVQGELATTVCTELRESGDDAFDDLLLVLGNRVDAYLGPLEMSLANPLFVENNVQVPTIDNGEPLYLNFQELEDYAGEWITSASDQVNSFLGISENDPSGELGINKLIRNDFLDDDGKVTVDPSFFFDSGVIFEGHDMLTQTTISIKSIHLEGLDSFKEVDILNAIGKHTLQNKLRLDYVHISIEMEAEMKASSLEDAAIVASSSPPLTENFAVDFTVSGIEIDASVFLGINVESLGNLELGSLLHSQNILPCLLSAVDDAKFTGLSVSVSDMDPPRLSGFVDSGIDHLVSTGAAAMFEMYEKVMIKAMPNFFELYVRDMANNFVTDALEGYNCPADGYAELDKYVDFRDMFLPSAEAMLAGGSGDSRYGDVIPWVMNIVEDQLFSANEEGQLAINNLLASFAERQSNMEGDFYYPGDLFRKDMDIALNGLNAAIELAVSDVRVSNIDSIGAPVNLLRPVKGEPSVLNNTALLGVGPEPFRAEFRLLVKGKGEEVEVHNDLVLGLSLANIGMVLEVLAQIRELSFLNFPLQDVLNLQCWLATVATPALDKYGIRAGESDSGMVLEKLALAVAEARLDIECVSCSSPLVIEMASTLGSQEAVEDTTAVVNMIFEYLSNLLEGDFVQSALDRMLNEAAMKCPHSPSYNRNFQGLKYDELIAPEKSGDSYEFLIAIIAVIGACTVVSAVVFVAARCVARRRHNRWVKTLNRSQKLELERVQNDEKERVKDLNSRMRSLVRSKEVPLLIRLFIPIVILGNIALFLSGHLSLGGTVNISGTFAGQDFDVQGFFEFSMAKSTIEMWNAGAKSLAILIVIFSGVWPYTKLLITLFIWFAPPKWLSSKRRGSLLHWLDVLGKWSMVDVFVLLLTLASFRLSVGSPSHLDFLPEDLYSINMLVVPLWGLYANMLAQFVAQILSHVIIHYHRKTAMAAVGEQEVDWNTAPSSLGDTRERLRAHRFKLDYEASSKRAVVRRSVDWMLSAALLLFAILVVCGCALPSFGIEVLGVVGLVVESGNKFEQANYLYSVFDLATMIMDQGRYLNTASDLVGLGTLASLLVITVFIMPLAQALSLLAQWFMPMTKKQRTRNTVLNEILGAWQYMEVYVLSIVIAAWQLGGVSEYMINAYCHSLKPTFTSLSHYGILDEDDAQCFRVDATVQSASWILVAASLILCILNHFVIGASSQKSQDDDIPAERRLHADRWLQRKQPTVTIHVDMSMSTSKDEEGGCVVSVEPREVCISPVRPRFTDYYFFATSHRTEEPLQDYEVETAIASIDEISSDK